ncbi:MAG: metal-sensing transcriptional repressor [Lachnospiraceae bacterium]|nr:metal-sensing transcriptional repressor [Lachnospiraceae bacterium]
MMPDCCSAEENGRHKHKPRTPEQVKALVNRLNRIEGQIGGIKKMIEENRYCPDVLIQVSSVQASLNSFNKELLSAHIKSCVVEDIKAGNEAVVDELCELLKKTMK